MKKARQRDMVGADLLAYFENNYYKRLPAGGARRTLDISRDYLFQWLHSIQVRLTLAFRKRVAKARWANVSHGLLSKLSTK
jgi:hypothetical protein